MHPDLSTVVPRIRPFASPLPPADSSPRPGQIPACPRAVRPWLVLLALIALATPPVQTSAAERLPGFLLREVYSGISGGALTNLTAHPSFPDQPDAIAYVDSFETPMDVGDNYGVRLSGYVVPSLTGDYVFYMASDDQGVLFLSPDENPGNKVQIAEEPGWNASRDWVGTANRPNQENISAPIHLESGTAYYVEALMKEAGGGDNLAVTWRIPGGNEPTNGAPPIPGEFLAAPRHPSALAVTMVQPPSDATVVEFEPVTFTVVVAGTPVITYQWLKNGVPIPQAAGPGFTISSVAFADNGATFSVIVSNALGTVVSSDATLTVVPDTVAPALLGAGGSATFDRVTVRFSEPVDPVEAADASHYALSDHLPIQAARVLSDGSTVVLQTGLQTPGNPYTVTVNGVHDRAATPNEIAPDSLATFAAFVLSTGYLRHEAFYNLPGDTVADLTNDFRFPDEPDSVGCLNQFEAPVSFADDYGVRLHGFLLPPLTGNYVFYLCPDSQGALFLSPDHDPAKRVLIAWVPYPTASRYWGSGGSGSVSQPIPLTAGRRYYVEALMKNQSGNDNLGVAWQLPGMPPPADGDPPISGSYLAVGADAGTASLTILRQPESLTVGDHQPARFSVRAASSSYDLLYQWQRDGLDIPGATGSGYAVESTTIADSGARFRCVVTVPGATVVSDEATLAVVADATSPTLVSAQGDPSLHRVSLGFSEPIDPTDAANSANYQLSGGVHVHTATLEHDQRTVLLETSPQVSGVEYMVTVNTIRDLSAAANPVAADSQIHFIAWVPEEFVGPFPSWADLKRDYGAVGDGVADDTAALQLALNELGTAGHAHVLYLPSGTYRITQTLMFADRVGAGILGEHPDTTTIRWDGLPDGLMLHWNGVGFSRMGRLTFDGAQRALTAIAQKYDHAGPHVPTLNEYADMVFRDVAFGMRIGFASNDDVGTVLRSRFLRCSQMGISMESYNALIWSVRQSSFQDCAIGVGNVLYAGACHVYDSLFERSTDADIKVGNCDGYFSFRGNTSIDSRAFFVATGPAGCAGNITLQRNTVIDPLDATPIIVGDAGPVMLIDNVIRSRPETPSGPAVVLFLEGAEGISVGNTYTTSRTVEASSGSVFGLDDRIVDRAALDLTPPELPGPLLNFHRTVIEVQAGADASAIQAALDAAYQLRGTRPVVHLPAGEYPIDRTLIVPAGGDVQLIGDGVVGATLLYWTGPGNGPVLRFEGPTHATVREFGVHGGDRATAIVVDNADQPGARAFIAHPYLVGSERCSVLLQVDRLDHTEVTVHDQSMGGARGANLRVVGGARQSRGEPLGGRVTVIGSAGGSVSHALAFDVLNGGRLLTQDVWHEGGSDSIFVRLTDSGSFTLQGAALGMAGSAGPDFSGRLEIEDFRGDATFLNTGFAATTLKVRGDGRDTSLLLIGTYGYPGPPDGMDKTYLQIDSPHTQLEWLSSFRTIPGIRESSSLDWGIADPAFLRRMLAQTRDEGPLVLTPKPSGVTDFRLYRVAVDRSSNGIVLSGTNAPPILTEVPDQLATEGIPLVITITASDSDLPFNLLTFTLGTGAPAGLELNPTNGVITWTPTEAQGPSTNAITVIATDDGSPVLSDTKTFQITVAEANAPPLLLGLIGIVTNSTFDGALDVGIPGNPLEPGSTTVNPDGTITVVAGGLGTWGEKDYLHFAYQEVVGDFDVSVRVSSLTPVDFATLLRLDDAREPGVRQPPALHGRDRCRTNPRRDRQPAGPRHVPVVLPRNHR